MKTEEKIPGDDTFDVVLGIRPEQSIALFRGELTSRFEPAPGACVMQAVLFTVDGATNRCTAAERVDIGD